CRQRSRQAPGRDDRWRPYESAGNDPSAKGQGHTEDAETPLSDRMARSEANRRVRDGRTRADEEGDAADSGRDVGGPGRNDGGAGAAVAPDGSFPGRRGGVPGGWGTLDLGASGVGHSAFGLAGAARVAWLGLVPRGASSQLGAGTAPGRRGA